jgi:hypothetical protein
MWGITRLAWPGPWVAVCILAIGCVDLNSPDTTPGVRDDDPPEPDPTLTRQVALPEERAADDRPQTFVFEDGPRLEGHVAPVEPTRPDLCDGLGLPEDVWEPDPGDLVLRDRETGSLWNVNGQAFDGPCRGAQLAQVPAFTAFWFSWSATRHGGEVWNLVDDNLPGEIEPDPSGACEVPCNEIRSGGPPPDGIPALDHLGRWDRPKPAEMVPPEDPGAGYLRDTDVINGVVLDGQARAYPHSIMIWHEIHTDQINDTEFNVTFCPLTGSALLMPVDQGESGPLYFYVSGRLYNDNLTMFEREVPQSEATFWNQMLRKGIDGARRGEHLEVWPIVETTWARWLEMHPDTLVTDIDTGYSRQYGTNPYDDDPNANTLFPVNPLWEPFYRNKDHVLAIDGVDTMRAYAYPEMGAFGTRVVVNDVLDDAGLVVLYESRHRMAIPYVREVAGEPVTFDGAVAE